MSLILLLNLIHADLDLKLFAGRDSVRREALRLTGITVANISLKTPGQGSVSVTGIFIQ